MILKYGSFAHVTDTVSLAISREGLRTERDERWGYRERWTIDGWLTGADAAALTTAIDALLAAYAADGSDLVLYLNDGSTPTSHSLDSSEAVGGVRIISGPDFPEGAGAEYAVIRNFRIVAEAVFEDTELPDLLSYNESISVQGTGGKDFVILTPLTGKPVKQLVSEATPVTITQDGSAVGFKAYPAVNSPILASDEYGGRRSISRERPVLQAEGTFRNYEIRWHYEFGTVAAPAAATVTPTAK